MSNLLPWAFETHATFERCMYVSLTVERTQGVQSILTENSPHNYEKGSTVTGGSSLYPALKQRRKRGRFPFCMGREVLECALAWHRDGVPSSRGTWVLQVRRRQTRLESVLEHGILARMNTLMNFGREVPVREYNCYHVRHPSALVSALTQVHGRQLREVGTHRIVSIARRLEPYPAS